MNIKNTFLVSVILTFSAFAMTAPAVAEAGYNCKSEVKATSTSVSKKTARWQARVAWRARVAKRYGPQYVIWRFAEDRSSSCKKRWGVGHQCTVRAKPCQ